MTSQKPCSFTQWSVIFLDYESIKRELFVNEKDELRDVQLFVYVWEFIIRVKRELKRVYRNGCRYNERLNAETGGS